MLGEIAAGLSSLNAAKDIAKGLDSLKTGVAVNQAKIDLQTLILEAQSALFAAQEAQSADASRISQLEQKIVQLEDWSAEAQRYQLKDVGRGAIVYMPKAGMENGEPAHWLCANCFNQRRKSFMQFKGQDRRPGGGLGDDSAYACDACKGSIKVHYSKKPSYEDSVGDSPSEPPRRSARTARVYRG